MVEDFKSTSKAAHGPRGSQPGPSLPFPTKRCRCDRPEQARRSGPIRRPKPYVILDLFSRYVVGGMVGTKECKHLAAQLFAEAIARHGVEPGLTVHATAARR